jgi:hypothetical protein
MLDLIKSNYQTGSFHVAEAAKLIKKEMKLRRTSVGNAIKTGVRTGEVRQIKKGIYTFQNQSLVNEEKDALFQNSLLFLQCAKSSILIEILRIVKTLSERVELVIQADAIHCILNDAEGHMTLDLRLLPSLFTSYKLTKQAIDLTADCGLLLERLQRIDGPVTLAMVEAKPNTLQIGDQFNLALENVTVLEKALELPKPSMVFKSELIIDRQQLERILSDNRVNSDYVDIIAEREHVLFQSFNEKGDYPGKPIMIGYTCKEPTRSRLTYLYLDYLIKALRAAKCESIRLKNGGSFLLTEFILDPSVKLSIYLACKSMQEEKKLAV